MAVDIAGWLEIRRAPPNHPFWEPLIQLDSLLLRQYTMFASLFDVRNGGHFQPLAARRGLPPGVSRQIRTQIQTIEEEGERAYHLTWIGWDEIKAIDWEEEEALYTILEYQQEQDGRFQQVNIFFEHPRITEKGPESPRSLGFCWRIDSIRLPVLATEQKVPGGTSPGSPLGSKP